jgi:hypothetical protein
MQEKASSSKSMVNKMSLKNGININIMCLQVAPKPFTYTPFGNNAHVCLGRELAQLEMFIFLHHFTTKYR